MKLLPEEKRRTIRIFEIVGRDTIPFVGLWALERPYIDNVYDRLDEYEGTMLGVIQRVYPNSSHVENRDIVFDEDYANFIENIQTPRIQRFSVNLLPSIPTNDLADENLNDRIFNMYSIDGPLFIHSGLEISKKDLSTSLITR